MAVSKNNKKVEETKVVAKPAKEEKTNRYAGKIIVYQDQQNFRFVLKASNGELLCTSETYASKQGVLSAIDTFKNNVENGIFSIYEDKHGLHQYLLSAKNNRIVIVGEIYKSRNSCLSAIESVKKFAATAEVSFASEDITSHYDIQEESFSADGVKTETSGKYEVLTDEDGKSYYVLKASNGVLLFTSKTFSTRKTCLQNIETFRQLLSENEFKIYKDKNKIFVFKIYNKSNALMVVGEHYDTRQKCQSALLSVVRFGKEAKVIEL